MNRAGYKNKTRNLPLVDLQLAVSGDTTVDVGVMLVVAVVLPVSPGDDCSYLVSGSLSTK